MHTWPEGERGEGGKGNLRGEPPRRPTELLFLSLFQELWKAESGRERGGGREEGTLTQTGY